MSIAHIIAGSSITIIIDFQPKVIPSSHPNYARIKQLVGDPNTTEQQVALLLDLPKQITDYTDGKVFVKNGKLFLKSSEGDVEVRNSLSAKILEFVRTGDDALAEPLKLFLEKVWMNPDPRVRLDLFDWLQAAKLPITGTGDVLAWKAVTDNYRSIYSPSDARFDHRVGMRVEQDRSECDANPDRTCSSGLHFCAASYLSNYAGGGSRIVVVKIHPKDIVSFPSDYHLRKGRACGYDIVGEVPYDKVAEYYPQGTPVYTGFDAAPKPKFKVEVGKVYRLRDGRTAVCVEVHGGFGKLRPTEGQDIVCYDTGLQYLASDLTDRRDVTKEIKFDLTPEDFEVGQKWINRAGKEVEIVRISGNVAWFQNGDAVYVDNGRVYLGGAAETERDVVFRLGWTPKAPGVGPLQLRVGDKVKLRNGQTSTVLALDASTEFPITLANGMTFTADGQYYGTRISPADIVSKA